MQTLAAMGTEIMWCDIGGPNMTTEFAMQYFNDAAARGKQVLLNNRCGLPGDFDTPEYARYESVQVRKWESNLGMDPFSYGYNRATPEEAYITPAAIVTSLLDIVSKNGNLLLDIGPTANGTIIEIEQRNLRIAGAWIKEHAEAVFNTTYWFVTPEEGQAVRFTQNANAFYIATLYPPNGTLVLDSPVPYVEGDAVEVVGGNMSGAVVPSRLLGNGSLEITVSEEVREADRFAWVFKIGFGGVEAESGPGNGSAVLVDGNANGTTNGSRPGGTGSPIATQANSGVGGVRAGVSCSTIAAVAVVMLVAFAC
jgi:alpha-L-fucosidase